MFYQFTEVSCETVFMSVEELVQMFYLLIGECFSQKQIPSLSSERPWFYFEGYFRCVCCVCRRVTELQQRGGASGGGFMAGQGHRQVQCVTEKKHFQLRFD